MPKNNKKTTCVKFVYLLCYGCMQAVKNMSVVFWIFLNSEERGGHWSVYSRHENEHR